MKHRHTHITLAAIVLIMLCSCVREQFTPSGLSGGEGYLYLQFGTAQNIEISTKASLKAESENRIMNLYLFVFDGNGRKIHSKFYDELERVNTEAELSSFDEGWYKVNSTEYGKSSTGTIKLKAPTGSGFKIYVFANIDGDMVKISSELLSHNIDTEDDIKNFKVYINQETTSRNGYFPMSGSIDNVTIKDGSNVSASNIQLERIDSKVVFTFKTGTRPDKRGQVIKSFEPKGWKVFNIPKTSYLMGHDEDACNVDPTTPTGDYSQYASMFFDSEWMNFEEFPDDKTSSFSFYMMENRQHPKNTSFTDYQQRSKRIKTSTGLNATQDVEYTSLSGKTGTKSMRLFENANDFSTYVMVSAKVTMELTGEEEGQTLGGYVQYIIHLGDWSSTIHNDDGKHWDDDEYSGVTNFETRRNVTYNYTVTINSVDNIRIEVETSDGANIENQPGAFGWVTVAKEEIAICDSHYESRTLTFHAKNMFEGTHAAVDDLSWRVVTPFNEGSPEVGRDGEDIPAGLDYKWVHFRLNKKDSDGKFYDQSRRKYTNRLFTETTSFRSADDNAESDGSGETGLAGYHNDGLMDIMDLVKYLKAQAHKYESWLRNGGNYDDYKCDFDSEEIDKAKICVTAFVDEYYYDADPIFGGSSPTLWKRFVNQSDRSIHLLSNSNTSKDLESSSTGSVITIQQKSIKSIFNTDEDYTILQNAWGLESVDEYASVVNAYDKDGYNSKDSGKNTDIFNGLANSVFEWGLAPSGVTVGDITTIQSGVRWDKYLDYETENSVPQMQSDYKYLRYICLSRNRDNNGNGIIERDELKWYLASIQQLVGIYVGGGVLDKSIRLYNRTTAERNSNEPSVWRQHIISSTNYEGENRPTVLWGEEGTSTGHLLGSFNWGDGLTSYTVRCVRNLGLSDDAPIKDAPDDFITATKNSDGSYTFECTHINTNALRYYTTRELDLGDENSELNHLYKKFETAPADKTWSTGGLSFKDLNNSVSAYGSSVYAGYCPDGYRLPNQVELAVMRYYTGSGSGENSIVSSGYYPSRTYWSFGVLGVGGTGKDGGNKYGFCADAGNIALSASASFTKARCVRDVRVE